MNPLSFRNVLVSVPLLLACVVSSACAPVATRSATEISLRNATQEAVRYTATLIIPGSKPATRLLEAGDLDRFETPIDVSFQRAGKAITYRLSEGRHYAFRYNEDEQLELYDASHGRSDAADLAPFVPTPMQVVEAMLLLAEVSGGDVLYDLGCGDGRIVIAAAQRHGARGVGVELDEKLVRICRESARAAGVEHLVEFRLEDATKTDFSSATVLALYLLPESNALLRPELERQLRPGTRVVTHNYPIPGWESKQVRLVAAEAEDGEMHTLYLYRR